MKIGANLRTVRDFTQRNKDFADTIKKISEMGYDSVLVAGVNPDINAIEIAETCKAYELDIAGTHYDPAQILKETDEVIEAHQIMQTCNVGISVLPERYPRTKFGVRGFITDYIPIARQLKDAGMKLMYHNHNIEFMKFDSEISKHAKTTAIEYIADKFPELDFNLDVFWVHAGGGDPEFWIDKLQDRITILQIKDMVIVEGRQTICEVMNGNFNWQAIFQSAKSANVEYLIVDQDEFYGKDPFDCLRESLQNIKGSGLL